MTAPVELGVHLPHPVDAVAVDVDLADHLCPLGVGDRSC